MPKKLFGCRGLYPRNSVSSLVSVVVRVVVDVTSFMESGASGVVVNICVLMVQIWRAA